MNRFRPVGLLLALTMLLCAVPAGAAPPDEESPAVREEVAVSQEAEAPAQDQAGSPEASEGAVTPGLDHFVRQAEYTDGIFPDVTPDNWSYSVIAACYEYGLMQGREEMFDRSGRLTAAEAVTMAARVHQIYRQGECTLTNGEPWYQPYLDYAFSAGIVREEDLFSWSEPISRADMAYVFSGALPAEEFPVIKTVESIPDGDQIPERDRAAVQTLYASGVLTGIDCFGTFNPNDSITREEAAAIIARVTLPEQRRTEPLLRMIFDGEITFGLPQGGEVLSSPTDAGSVMYQVKGTGIVVDIHRQNNPELEGKSLADLYPTAEDEKTALENRSGSAWLSDCVVSPVWFDALQAYQATGNYASERFSYPMQVCRFISGPALCRILVTWNENTADQATVDLVRASFSVNGHPAMAQPPLPVPAEDPFQPEQPEQPDENAQPEQTEQPAENAQPEQTEQPAETAQPEQAEQPAETVQPDAQTQL